MKVKELAELARTTVRTVRYYHQISLLPLPAQRHGWRDYGMAHVARLLRVRWLVDAGVPLTQVKEMLAAEPASPFTVPPGAPGSADLPDDGSLARASILTDLRHTLDGVDRQIADLTSQRGRLAGLIASVEADGPLTPVPPQLVWMYTELMRRAPSERARRIMQSEWDVLEVACYRMELPHGVVEFVDRLSAADLDRIAEFFDRFQQLTGTRATDVEEQLRALAAEVAQFSRAVAPEVIADWEDLMADGSYAWAWRAFILAFPGRHYRIYAEAIAEELGVRLSAEDHRALKEWESHDQHTQR